MRHRSRLASLAFLLGLAATAAPAQDEPAARRAIGASGLPLPRFASLASGEVNVRTGPGMEYSIRWVYTRPGLPVQVLEEFDVWRLVQDPDGGQGWTHSSLLSTQRNVMVRRGTQALHRSADPDSRVLLRAEEGVIGGLLGCEQGWCRVEIADRRGWLPREAVWGVLPGEWRGSD
jgi:SH3-like domain-containing protein